MADFDLALALTADGAQAVGEVDRVSAALDKTAAAERSAASAATVLESATGKATAAAVQQAGAQGQAGKATAEAATASQRLVVAHSNLAASEARATTAATALAAAEVRVGQAAVEGAQQQTAAAAAVVAAQDRVAKAGDEVRRSQGRLNSEFDSGTRAANKNGYAIRNVGQQFGDFGLQVAGGQSVARAFGQQAGQLGYALSEMGGKLGKVGTFLVGPWGIALTIGAAFAAPLIEKLFQVGRQAEDNADKLAKASAAADSYGTAQGILGRVIDLTTGKLKTQNGVLLQTIKLQTQANILAAQAKIDALKPKPDIVIKTGGQGNLSPGGIGGFGNFDKSVAAAGQVDAQQKTLDRITESLGRLVASPDAERNPTAYAAAISKGIDNAIRGIDRLATGAKFAGRSVLDVKSSLLSIGTLGTDKAAGLLSLRALAGGGVDDLLKPYEKPDKPKKPPKPKSTEARDEFGRDAEDKLAALRDSISDTPSVVRQVNQQIRQLDDLMDDLARKKPPGFEKLIAEAKELRPLIANGINKPFDDFVKSQGEQLQILKLQSAGQNDQAEALRTIFGLEKQIGPLTPARKDAVLKTVEALRAEQRQIDINREHTGLYLGALSQIKGVVEEATQAFVRGDLGQFIKSPKKLLDAFQNLQGQALFSKLFGDVFRDLQDQVNGVSTVKEASDRMAEAVDQVTKQTGQTTTALADLPSAARGAASAVSGQSANPVGSSAGSPVDPETGDIVVTGKRTPSIRRNPTELFTQAIGQVGTKVAGIFTNPESAAKIGANIGKFAGKGLEGAATGTFVNGLLEPVGKALGFKTSKLGAQIGGAAGSFLPIPFGKEVGAVVGSVIGGLFKKDKSGSSTLSISNGTAEAGAATGRGSAAKKQADALGGSLADGLNSIAQQLGAQLGTASVSVGYRPGHKAGAYRVDPTGSGKVAGGSVAAFETEAEAIAFALRDAILDGAVGGLSAAMNEALRQNTDVDKAVSEALKVKQIETLIGGIGGQLKAAFDDVARNAADRLRVAKQYGLDVVAVEKANADERAKLIDATLKESVGSLQDFLASMSAGDLFEGSGADKRKAILADIATAEGKAKAGEAGAADTLAQLYRNLLTTSKDTFGTAGGEYADDRSTANAGATAVINAERDRINAAAGVQQATVDALQQGNALTNETNDLLARQTAALTSLPADLAQQLATYGGGLGSIKITARNVDLA